MNPKKQIRIQMLKKRRAIASEEILRLSDAINEILIEQEPFCRASCIASYSAFDNEVDTGRLHSILIGSPKILCLPRIERSTGTLFWHRVNQSTKMTVSPYGILEPADNKMETNVSVTEIELFLVPGICFDLKGYRLGYGRGYYDRTLSAAGEKNSTRIGLAYDFQLIDSIPHDQWDQRMDIIITENRVINCGFK